MLHVTLFAQRFPWKIWRVKEKRYAFRYFHFSAEQGCRILFLSKSANSPLTGSSSCSEICTAPVSLTTMADVAARAKSFLSDKVAHFTESVIREMTRQAMLYNAANLAQGFPDFPAPREIKEAAQEAIAGDVNQYAITWGAKNLRQAIARQMQVWQ